MHRESHSQCFAPSGCLEESSRPKISICFKSQATWIASTTVLLWWVELTLMLDVWTSASRICSGFRLHSSLSCFFRPMYFSSMLRRSPYRTGVEPSSLITASQKSFYVRLAYLLMDFKVFMFSLCLASPVISKCMELSMGSGSDRKLKGSKRALIWPQVLHFTWDLSCPWKRSTTIERFLRKWFSQACDEKHTDVVRVKKRLPISVSSVCTFRFIRALWNQLIFFPKFRWIFFQILFFSVNFSGFHFYQSNTMSN